MKYYYEENEVFLAFRTKNIFKEKKNLYEKVKNLCSWKYFVCLELYIFAEFKVYPSSLVSLEYFMVVLSASHNRYFGTSAVL